MRSGTEKTIALDVFGLVQGVYFRKNTLAAAQRYQIRGFVRNEPDGSVHIVASGKPAALNAFLGWCKKGDPPAVVDRVNVKGLALSFFDRFEIQPSQY